MPRPAKSWHFLVVLLLLLPLGAMAADIEINGTCVVGTCGPPAGPSDALQFNQSVGPTSGSYALSFLDGDSYLVSWTYSASYSASGTELAVNPVATYTGASPSVGNDVIDFSFFQNFYDTTPGTWDGDYTESVPLSLQGNVGAGSTVQGQLFFNGQGLGLVGPYGPGYNFGTNTKFLSGLTNSTLFAEYDFVYDFQAGTQQGATASSVPEPGQTLLLAAVLLAGLLWRHWIARGGLGYSR